MKEKSKNVIQTIVFVFILFLVLFLNILKEDEIISNSERRKLATFPKISFKNITSSKFSEEFEKYAMDQFVFRDFFRGIKSRVEFDILNKKDNNKLFAFENSLFKIEYPLRENSIKKSAEKFNKIKEKYLKDSKVYYAIIPDKTYYLNENLRLSKIKS